MLSAEVCLVKLVGVAATVNNSFGFVDYDSERALTRAKCSALCSHIGQIRIPYQNRLN